MDRITNEAQKKLHEEIRCRNESRGYVRIKRLPKWICKHHKNNNDDDDDNIKPPLSISKIPKIIEDNPKSSSSLAALPLKIMCYILTMLNGDTPTALTCRLVCKAFENLISYNHQVVAIPNNQEEFVVQGLLAIFPFTTKLIWPDLKRHCLAFDIPPEIELDVSQISKSRILLEMVFLVLKEPKHRLVFLLRAEELYGTQMCRERALIRVAISMRYLELGESEIALSYIEKSLAIERTHEALAAKGRVCMALGRYEEALPLIEQAIDMGAIQLQACRGEAHLFLKNTDEAIRDFNYAIEQKYFVSSDTYALRGYAYAQKYRYRDALDDYSKAISLAKADDGFLGFVYANRAWAYYRLEEHNKVLADCELVFERTGRIMEIWLLSLVELGQKQKAYEMACKAIDEFPAANKAPSLLVIAYAVTLHAIKRFKDAKVYFDCVLEIDPSDQWVNVRRVKTYCHFGLYQEALDGVNLSLQRYPSNRVGLYYRSYVLEKMERYAEAARDLSKLFEEDEKLGIVKDCRRRQKAEKRMAAIQWLLKSKNLK